MSREILISTPENIQIEYELAGVGTRLIANIVDILIQLVVLICSVLLGIVLISAVVLINAHAGNQLKDFLEGIAQGILSFLVFFIIWGYFLWFEIRWNGETPGKRMVGIRVIREGGYPVNASAVVARNLLRVIDGMPLIMLGLIIGDLVSHDAALAALGGSCIMLSLGLMLFTSRYQRLGDIVAGTIVIKQRSSTALNLDALFVLPRVMPSHLASYALDDIGRHVYEMSVAEYRAVRHYLSRRNQLPYALQQFAAMILAVPLMCRLEISPPDGVQRINYADFLEYIAVAFEQHRGAK